MALPVTARKKGMIGVAIHTDNTQPLILITSWQAHSRSHFSPKDIKQGELCCKYNKVDCHQWMKEKDTPLSKSAASSARLRASSASAARRASASHSCIDLNVCFWDHSIANQVRQNDQPNLSYKRTLTWWKYKLGWQGRTCWASWSLREERRAAVSACFFNTSCASCSRCSESSSLSVHAHFYNTSIYCTHGNFF
jgi:hypothetical protein